METDDAKPQYPNDPDTSTVDTGGHAEGLEPKWLQAVLAAKAAVHDPEHQKLLKLAAGASVTALCGRVPSSREPSEATDEDHENGEPDEHPEVASPMNTKVASLRTTAVATLMTTRGASLMTTEVARLRTTEAASLTITEVASLTATPREPSQNGYE